MSEKLATARREYADQWDASSSAFAAAGHYAWMARFLEGYSRVFEIGTGTGHSTVELLDQGHVVVGVDENIECLNRAAERIRARGHHVQVVARSSLNPSHDLYQLGFRKIGVEVPRAGALLLEGDVFRSGAAQDECDDRHLFDWLRSQSLFDAVACWLVGTHNQRSNNANVNKFGLPDAGHYRLAVQNFVYELSDRILRPGGILHVVDRREDCSSPALRADALGGHREQASVTSLVVLDELEQRAYEEPAAGGVQMGITVPLSGRAPDVSQLYFASTRARKQESTER